MKNRIFLVLVLGCVLACASLLVPRSPVWAQDGDKKEAGDKKKEKLDPAALEFFEKKILPALKEHCYECHSSDSAKLSGDLSLESKADMLRGGLSGPVLVPSQPGKSLLISVIKYGDNDLQMPPEGKLPDEVIANFVKWVAMGAPDPRTGKAPPKNEIKHINVGTGWNSRTNAGSTFDFPNVAARRAVKPR